MSVEWKASWNHHAMANDTALSPMQISTSCEKGYNLIPIRNLFPMLTPLLKCHSHRSYSLCLCFLWIRSGLSPEEETPVVQLLLPAEALQTSEKTLWASDHST